MLISRFCAVSLLAMASVLSGCGGEQPGATGASAAVQRGQTLYFQCRACHSLNEGGPNKVGPNLFGIFGSKAGVVPGFAYSDALADSDVVWTLETLDGWLARPSEFLPGNQMIFVGIKNAQDRANLLTYLQQETGAQ